MFSWLSQPTNWARIEDGITPEQRRELLARLRAIVRSASGAELSDASQSEKSATDSTDSCLPQSNPGADAGTKPDTLTLREWHDLSSIDWQGRRGSPSDVTDRR